MTRRTCSKASHSRYSLAHHLPARCHGSGKTTLIRSILGLTHRTRPYFAFDGQDITALPTHKVIARAWPASPKPQSLSQLTVEENLGSAPTRNPPMQLPQERMAEIFRFVPAPGRASDAARRHHVGRRAGMVSIVRGLMRAPGNCC